MFKKNCYSVLTVFVTLLILLACSENIPAQTHRPRFKVIVLAEHGGLHAPFVEAAKVWLHKLAADSNFVVDYIENTDKINDAFLANYQLFIQLNYPPYNWTDTAKEAFIKYITNGKGGWIGFHHATLLGEFDGFKMWDWFYKFMGNIRFKNYIPDFEAAVVNVEDKNHPCMKGVPAAFVVTKDEWYTYDADPRPNVHVLASVDEATYTPDTTSIKMGDHPVVWTNENYKARNIYIFMGHHPNLFENAAYKTLFRNAIFWAASK